MLSRDHDQVCSGFLDSSVMTSASVPPPIDEPSVPGRSPASLEADRPLDPSDPEAVRKVYSRDEAYVRAVGRVNYFHAICFGAGAFYYIRFAYLHLTGEISAPWILRPGWIALQADLVLTAIFALIAGYGLCRLKRWAFGVEVVLLYGFALALPLGILAYSRPTDPLTFAAGLSLMSALAAPLLNLVDIRRSVVLTPDYRRVIEATPGIRVKARLPWGLKLASLLLAVIYLVLCGLIVAKEVREKANLGAAQSHFRMAPVSALVANLAYRAR